MGKEAARSCHWARADRATLLPSRTRRDGLDRSGPVLDRCTPLYTDILPSRMVNTFHSIPIYTQISLIVVKRVEFSRSTSLAQVPYVSTVVDEEQYPGRLAHRQRNSSELFMIGTLTLKTDVGVEYDSIVLCRHCANEHQYGITTLSI